MFFIVILSLFFMYSQFHKTLLKSSLQMHWISVRFYEMGDILKKISDFLIKKLYLYNFGWFVCEFITIYFLLSGSGPTFPEVDPDPAKWYGSNRIWIRIRIQNSKHVYQQFDLYRVQTGYVFILRTCLFTLFLIML